MKKSILASIKPKYCELIASGKKTVEIRKNRPKIDVPFKVYIYETKTVYVSRSKENDVLVPTKQNMGKVIGEFVCDYMDMYVYSERGYYIPEAQTRTCLTDEEIERYGGGVHLYGWHISDLVIYDKPKELSEFNFPSDKYCEKGLCGGCPHDCTADVYGDYYYYDCEWKRPLMRPPQSWCYVEKL